MTAKNAVDTGSYAQSSSQAIVAQTSTKQNKGLDV